MNKIVIKIKQLIKRISFIKTFYIFLNNTFVVRLNIINVGLYTTLRTLKYSLSKKNVEAWKASLRVSCHIVEKGLTMPEKRLGFGQDRVVIIANEVLKNPKNNNLPDVCMAIGIIKEYDLLHKTNQYKLPVNLQSLIDEVCFKYNSIENLEQIKTNKDNFFKNSKDSFPIFAKSRKSIRNFSGAVSANQINNAIELALTAPSACNRQAIKCHIFEDKEMVKKILLLQNGNRGFGHLIPQICIITADLRMIGHNEQNDIYFNAGLFAMNLSYAFHHFKVGSCMLNWSVVPKKDKALRKLINLPNYESIVVVIGFGNPNSGLEIAKSQKKELADTIVYH